MGWKNHLKLAVAAAAVAFAGVGTANAQECLETEFRAKQGQAYLDAENSFTAENNQEALQKLNALRAMELNCYEEGAAIRLGAAIKIRSEDFRGAVQDLEALLSKGYVTAADRPQTLYNIATIYLQIDDRAKAAQTFERWLATPGVRPTRDQNWTLATLYYTLGNARRSLEFAEKVFAADGPGASRQVYDFLILLYTETGQRGKRAQLLETLLTREPGDKKLWQIITADYFESGEERKAFEMQKAMYFAGLLKEENELMQIVNFYNRFDVPYEAAKMLEKEMNAGRIEKTFERMELLANLYQVAREYDKAIPVIRAAAQMRDSGDMYFRLGRSYEELQRWDDAEKAMQTALTKTNLRDKGTAWVTIGKARYERKNREGAREAFREAAKFPDGRNAARGWLDFMDSEDATSRALVVFEQQQRVITLENEKRACDQLIVLGPDRVTPNCADVGDRIAAEREKLQAMQG